MQLQPQSSTLEHPIRVAGLSARTSNAREADPATAQMPGLWGRFFSEGYAARSEGRTRYGVYTGYDSGVNGAYTVLIGAEEEGVEGNLTEVEIPVGRYLVFTSAGELPDSVISGWQEVWAYFEQPGASARAYTADFEEYDPLTPNEVRIHIAVE